MQLLHIAKLIWALLLAKLIGAQDSSDKKCHVLPGDAAWPNADAWSTLNNTVNGKLVKTVPIGSPCHDPNYDETACSALKAQWNNPLTHTSSGHSIMQAYFATQECDPFGDRAKPCTLGNYVAYSVKATEAWDIVAALEFAKAENIRVLARNTGHDFLGRSTGAGALAVWTQGLKNITFGQWSDKYYTGSSVTVGAGVLGYELVEAAGKQGMTVISGECATVGLAGFTQGGGHSILSSEFGLAADQVLSYEVVTAGGDVLIASPTENSDLYWALSGGGGGTYGIITSITLKAHESKTVGGAAMQLLASSTTTENYAALTAKFVELLPAMIDAGAMVIFLISTQYIVIKPLTLWDSTEAKAREVLKPFSDYLVSLGITPPIAYTELAYRDHYERYLGPLPQGSFEVSRYQFGGRLIPRDVVENNAAELNEVLAELTKEGVLLAGSSADYSKRANTPENSVLPAWRGAITQLQLITNWNSTAPWTDMEAAQKKMTEVLMPKIEAVTPGSGSYMSEADFQQPNWQTTFYGSNYAKLKTIKDKYDPEHVFYNLKSVGSDAWTVAKDGRMCRA
ncbi:FAD-binding domain-containing protein [Didymella exigua CBS 183.55]|uniref:FAD-binding domain-containing protein n=1 Tax=Didymella exigua CBS 183.55 TaxID=1150837 RepID=A0A6A5RYA8_9PLEO|nr:FAD-binding domain-containing protein [Didymella exigua CBS 183.55]KAF1932822.1 FAD-binding domain-containing protein [Didymella exigua CBS 183.55]